MIETQTYCKTCGKKFFTSYYHGGSIEHDNYTNDWNMNVLVNRFKDNERNKYEEVFLDSIMLNGNLCNIKDMTYNVAMEIFECRILWLTTNNYLEIAEYLESNRLNIKKEFNKVTQYLINEKLEEIESLKKRFLKES